MGVLAGDSLHTVDNAGLHLDCNAGIFVGCKC